MMIKIYLIFAFLMCHVAFSQVGIGTSNIDASAVLHLNSKDKGLLLPRVALKSTDDITTIPNPTNGLMVYNTDNSTASIEKNKKVFANLVYTYNGTVWQTLMSDNTGLLTLNLPQIYTRGRKSTSKVSCYVKNPGVDAGPANGGRIVLDTYDAHMVPEATGAYKGLYTGMMVANRAGFYKFNITLTFNFNYDRVKGYAPVIAYGYKSADSNSLSFLFKPINGTGFQDYKVSYSGIVYLNVGEVSGYFGWGLGGSSKCTREVVGSVITDDSIGEGEILWEYLGESL